MMYQWNRNHVESELPLTFQLHAQLTVIIKLHFVSHMDKQLLLGIKPALGILSNLQFQSSQRHSIDALCFCLGITSIICYHIQAR
jgi:hypothetical protein